MQEQDPEIKQNRRKFIFKVDREKNNRKFIWGNRQFYVFLHKKDHFSEMLQYNM